MPSTSRNIARVMAVIPRNRYACIARISDRAFRFVLGIVTKIPDAKSIYRLAQFVECLDVAHTLLQARNAIASHSAAICVPIAMATAKQSSAQLIGVGP